MFRHVSACFGLSEWTTLIVYKWILKLIHSGLEQEEGGHDEIERNDGEGMRPTRRKKSTLISSRVMKDSKTKAEESTRLTYTGLRHSCCHTYLETSVSQR
jgi:hypothetical protein